MKLKIEHRTAYRYSQPVRYAIQSLCLTPRTGPTQVVLHWEIKAPGHLVALQDAYGNLAHTLSLNRPLSEKVIAARGEVDTLAVAEFHENGAASPLVFLRETALTRHSAAIAAFAAPHFAGPPTPASLLALAAAIGRQVRYKPGSTEVSTTAEEAFELAAGVCQDQAHVFIAACRVHRVPARYVSGYFHAPNAPELASHAWADVCIDVATQHWVSIDVTHQCLSDERHVRLAVGVDYAACAPVRGIRHGGGDETMEVSIRIAGG
jgi:transglutaminase-like putative cysteine protease